MKAMFDYYGCRPELPTGTVIPCTPYVSHLVEIPEVVYFVNKVDDRDVNYNGADPKDHNMAFARADLVRIYKDGPKKTTQRWFMVVKNIVKVEPFHVPQMSESVYAVPLVKEIP